MKHIYDNQDGNQNNKSTEERFTERFKELASSYEPTFEPADWSAMQSKLAIHNEKDRRKVIFRRLATFATISAAAVALLFFGSQFLDNSTNTISNENIAYQENSIQKTNSTKINSTSTNSTTTYSTDDKNITQNELKENLESSKINSTKNTNQNFTKTKSNSENKIESSNSIRINKNQIAKSNSISNSDNNVAFSSSNLSTLKTNSEEKVNLITSLLTDNEQIKQAESNKMLSVLRLEKTDFDLFVNLEPKEIPLPELKLEENIIASNQNEEVIRKNPVLSAIGKWRIGATLMAMTNIYKSNGKQRMNYSNGYGIMADYQVAKRFNISAGAVYTQKRIDLEEPLSIPTISNNLNPNDDAWVKKNKTQINWQLVDLPIHLRYNAIETDRNKWFVSAGTSNYFFLKENYQSDYTVSYQDIYDPRLTRSQEVVRQRETQSAIQLFATINVSVGLETSLGKHLTLQVEPYWRFPVRSLGSEGVFVQTGGLLTRINFAL